MRKFSILMAIAAGFALIVAPTAFAESAPTGQVGFNIPGGGDIEDPTGFNDPPPGNSNGHDEICGRVCWDWSFYCDTRLTQHIERRPKHTIFFIPEQPTVRGMRIQRTERDSWTSDVPLGFERRVQ